MVKWLKENIKAVVFYIVFFLFILAFSTTAKNYDYDFWARLIAGMSVVQAGHVLKHDFLSYTPTHTWYDHEWGSGVIFYLTQHIFGPAGILILQAILIFLIFFMISRVVKLRGVKTTTPYNFFFYYFSFTAVSCSLNNPIRCQMFSFLFFTIYLYILERVRLGVGKNKTLIWLPVIMLIWNNLHGGCVSGIGLIVLYIIGEALDRKPVKQYIYALIGSLLVLPINPWGFEYLGFLFKATTMSRENVVEWWGLFSKEFTLKFIKFKVFASILLFVESGVIIKQLIDKSFKFDKIKFIVLAVTLFLGFQHVKLIPFAVITLCCFLYDDFYTAFNGITKNVFNNIAVVKDTFVYIIILFFAVVNINAKAFRPLADFSGYPLVEIEFIKLNNLKGNLFIGFGYGSYASYKLYPNNKILIDGRYEEVYYDDLTELLKNFYLIKPGWDEMLKKYPPDIMVIEKFYPVYFAILKKKEYRPIFEDKSFIVFIKSNIPKRKYKAPSTDINYYRKTLFDTDINFMLKSKNDK